MESADGKSESVIQGESSPPKGGVLVCIDLGCFAGLYEKQSLRLKL
jgi:hypothetical protein